MILNSHPIYPSTGRYVLRLHRELQKFTCAYAEITTLRLAAKAAYQVADAMLAERAK